MRFIVYIILIICTFLSCSKVNKHTYGVTFPEEIVIDKSKEIYSKEVMAISPSQLILKDSLLFLWNAGGCAALIFNEKSMEEVAKFGMKGVGPEFFQSPHYVEDVEQSDYFYVEDVTLASLRKFRMYKQKDSLYFEKTEQKSLYQDVPNRLVCSNGNWINNQYYASYKWWPKNEETTFFALLDKNLKYLTSFMNLPVPETSNDFRMFNGHQASRGNLFYFVCYETGYIICYEINSPQDIKKKWEYWFNKPLYSVKDGHIRWDDENLIGCYDIKVTSKFVYCLYSGKKYTDNSDNDELPETILVFDLEGTPIKKIHLNSRFVRFAVSEDDRYIYLLCALPDIGIAKYQIN